MVRLVKEGEVAKLEVLNAGANPQEAERLGVRSVPWVRIGDFIFSGPRSYEELKRWARATRSTTGRGDYLVDLLASGGIGPALDLVRRHSEYLDALIPRVAVVDSPLQVRVGIGAIIEHLQGSKELAARVEPLAALTEHGDARVRADACHYLALTRSPAAVPHVRGLLDDADAEVREIAAESLAALNASGQNPSDATGK